MSMSYLNDEISDGMLSERNDTISHRLERTENGVNFNGESSDMHSYSEVDDIESWNANHRNYIREYRKRKRSVLELDNESKINSGRYLKTVRNNDMSVK